MERVDLAVIDRFEQKLVRNCAATLMGVKPASLFACCDRSCFKSNDGFRDSSTCDSQWRRELSYALSDCRRRMSPRGIEIVSIAELRRGPLVYVYRPAFIHEELANPQVSSYLERIGYPVESFEDCLGILSRRLEQSICGARCDFPHEIGFFLGYPFKDVVGFIENQGENYQLLGCWKVYSDVDSAKKRFASYRECTRICESLYKMGVNLECMTDGFVRQNTKNGDLIWAG